MNTNKLGESLWTIHIENMRVLDQIVEASRTRGENGMLLYLYHVGRPMFPGELTEKLGLTTGRIANILKELEKSGLVVRTPDALDKRRVQVALTRQGEEAARAQNEEAVRYHAMLLSLLSEDEARQFLEMLQRMTSVLNAEGSGQAQ